MTAEAARPPSSPAAAPLRRLRIRGWMPARAAASGSRLRLDQPGSRAAGIHLERGYNRDILTRYVQIALLSTVVLSCTSAAQTTAPRMTAEPGGRPVTLLVLPFENASKVPGIEWIGEAFSEILAQRMASPTLHAIGREE